MAKMLCSFPTTIIVYLKWQIFHFYIFIYFEFILYFKFYNGKYLIIIRISSIMAKMFCSFPTTIIVYFNACYSVIFKLFIYYFSVFVLFKYIYLFVVSFH